MYVRTKVFKNRDGSTRTYLQLVKAERVNGKVRQRVVANLGRLEHLQEGALDKLIEGLVRFSRSEWIRGQALQMTACRAKSWGCSSVFYRLWQQVGLEEIITRLHKGSQVEADINEALFAMVLNRLMEPCSKLMVSQWMRKIYRPQWEGISLHHLYKALDFVATHKEHIERFLFHRVRDLFRMELDLVLWDATTTYFEGRAAEGLARYGFSKDKRPDRLQIMIGVLTTGDGFPIAHEVFAGNTAEVRTFREAIRKVKETFRLGRVILVADRGMVSQEVLKELEREGLQYIVGVKLRKLKVAKEVLARAGRYKEVGESLKVKEVVHQGKRYIVCLNPQERERDRAVREEVIEELKAKLRGGERRALIGNRVYRRYLEIKKDALRLNKEKIRQEALYDGKYVLLTNSGLDAAEVALSYKGLWVVERAFRELKSTLDLRPVYHWTEKRIRGHVMVCFLAFMLEMSLKKKLDERDKRVKFRELLIDLEEVRAVEIEVDGKRYVVRTELQGEASSAFSAVGLRPPPRVMEVPRG